MVRGILLSTAVLMAISSAVSPLHAQTRDQPGRRASFSAGASFGDGGTALALSAGLGFRLAPRLGLEFEVAYARRLDFTIDPCPSPLVCVIGGQVPVTGRTVSLVPHLVVELVPASRRVRAYVQGGIGGGHVRQRYVVGPPFTTLPVDPVEFTRSKVVLALSFGGGAAVEITPRLALGIDLRALQLFDEEPTPARFITPAGRLGTLRVGSRVSWLF